MSRKGGKGRKSIAIAKIENESHLQVTFSKRRDGFLKKLSEFCILCDVEVATIIFSPGNKKVYSFGHPSLPDSMNKYFTDSNVDPMVESESDTFSDITQKEEDLAKEKAKGKQLDDLIKATEHHYMWDGTSHDQLTEEQLAFMKMKLEEVYNDCEIQKLEFRFEGNNVGEAGPSGTNT